MKYQYLLFMVIKLLAVEVAQGQVLAYEGFDYFNGAVVNLNQINNGKFTGTTVTNWDKSLGWASDWQEASSPAVTTRVGTSVSATYTSGSYDLITSGHFAISGSVSIGRKLQNSPAGPFGFNGTNTSTTNTSNGTSYLTSGNFTANTYTPTTTAIGADGRTLWLSFLLEKNTNNNNAAYVSLHRNDGDLYDGNSGNHIAVGYFGPSSNALGVRYWSIRINGTVTRTTVPVTLATWTLLVARIDFNTASGTTVTLYVNPTNLGSSTPPAVASGTASAAVGMNNSFRNLAYYGGAVMAIPDHSGLDEIRIAADYKSATTASNLIRVEGEICGGKLGNNIFSNGDFDSYTSTPTTFTASNFPWSTAPAVRSIDNVAPWTDVTGGTYCYVDDINTVGSGGPLDGSYTIVDGARSAWGVWVTSTDYSGSGYLMLANAAFQPGVFFRQQQTGTFCEQTTYEYSVWVKNADQQQFLTAYGSSGTTQAGFRTCDPVREPGCEQLSQLLGSTSGSSPYNSASTSRNTTAHQRSGATGCSLYDWYVSGTVGTDNGSGSMYRVLPDIEFIIGDGSGNDVVAYSPPAPIPNDGLWHKVGFTFTTKPGVTTLELKIRNKAPGGGGNDILLDNFSFRACGPNVTLDMSNFPACTPGTVNTTTGTGFIGPTWSTTRYRWQKKTGTGSWMDIPNAPDASSYTVQYPDVLEGDSVRVNVASSTSNLGNYNCSVLSNVEMINCLIPLPAELLSLKARKMSAGVQLSWQTASENNSDYFVVERSADGRNFIPLQQVKAAGRSTQMHSYYGYDNAPTGGVNYYRLKMVDRDGRMTYSKPVTISFDANPNGLTLVPNPAQDKTTIVFAQGVEKEEKVLIRLVTLVGHTIRQEYRMATSQTKELVLDTSDLTEGTYILEVITNQQTFTQKLVITR